jgi:hypothetical protein
VNRAPSLISVQKERLRKGLEIRLPSVNPFFGDYQPCLLGSIRGVVTNLPGDLFNKLSRRSIQYSANWYPRKCTVILFCCDSDNVPFVLFFHKHSSSPFSRFKLYRDSALRFCPKVNNHKNYRKDGFTSAPSSFLQRLSVVLVIFHSKNFLHWTFSGRLLQFLLNLRIDIADSDTESVKLPVDEKLKDSRPAINDFDCGVFLFLDAF